MVATIGRILGIAVRGSFRGPMIELSEARATQSAGLEGDLASRPDRGVTLLAARQWALVQRELQADIPWHARRANILVGAESLGSLIGRVLEVGDVRIHVLGETKPCHVMDRVHPGLRAVLTPDYRAGVHGRILRSGTLRVGASLVLLNQLDSPDAFS